MSAAAKKPRAVEIHFIPRPSGRDVGPDPLLPVLSRMGARLRRQRKAQGAKSCA